MKVTVTVDGVEKEGTFVGVMYVEKKARAVIAVEDRGMILRTFKFSEVNFESDET